MLRLPFTSLLRLSSLLALGFLPWSIASGLAIQSVHAQDVPRAHVPEATGTISGTIQDEAGRPVRSAAIGVVGTSLSAETNAQGQFTLTGVPSGPRRLTVERLGFRGTSLPVTVRAGEVARADIRLVTDAVGVAGIDVYGSAEVGFRPSEIMVGTRIPAPLATVPQSVQSVTQALIEDRQIQRLGDAVDHMAGVSSRPSGFNLYDVIVSRGFSMTNSRNYFRNGTKFLNFTFPSMNTLERVELLKGPASVLYGSLEPGGVVNLVTKKPQAVRSREVALRTGTDGTLQPRLDFTGPLDSEARVRYRVNALVDNSRTFRDQVRTERFHLSPHLAWDVGPRTSLTLELEWLQDDRTFDPGLVAEGERPVDVPRDRFFGEPWTYGKYQDRTLGYALGHRFRSGWELRHASRFSSMEEDRLYFQIRPLAADGRTLPRRLAHWNADLGLATFNVDLGGSLATGPLTHHLLVGAEAYRFTSDRVVEGVDYTPLDIRAPTYLQDRPAGLQLAVSTDLESRSTIGGFYLQDRIEVGDRLTLLAGIRRDEARIRSENRRNDQVTETEEGAWTPRVGAVVQLREEFSVYASHARSYVPISGETAGGDPFVPEEGVQNEAGIRWMLADGGLVLSTAVFRLAQENLRTPDPDNPGFQVQVGERATSGIEVDAAGRIGPDLRVQASVARLRGEIVASNDDRFPVGNTLANLPRTDASAWLSWDLSSGPLAGAGLRGGVFHSGARQGDLGNSFELPAYTRADLGAAYRTGRYRVNLTLRNLTDAMYWEGANSRNTVRPGQGRTLLLDLSARF